MTKTVAIQCKIRLVSSTSCTENKLTVLSKIHLLLDKISLVVFYAAKKDFWYLLAEKCHEEVTTCCYHG